jgi:elongator complex protein 2
VSYQVLTDHAGSINCINSLSGLLATGSSDGTVIIYQMSAGQYTLKQTLKMYPVYPLTLSFCSTADGTLLAIGGSSRHIYLYTSQLDSIYFTSAAVLKGHEDWIRGLAFTSSNSDIYLASSSQDRYIRLWKITKSTSSTSKSELDVLYTPS